MDYVLLNDLATFKRISAMSLFVAACYQSLVNSGCRLDVAFVYYVLLIDLAVFNNRM